MNEQRNHKSIRQQFDEEYALDSAVKLSFPASLNQAMKAARWSNESLAEKIGVSPDTVKRYRNEKSLPSKPMAVALCIALKLEYEQSLSFLEGIGMAVTGGRKEDCAYRKLLQNHIGKTVDDCNKTLESMGIDRSFHLYPRSSNKQ